MKKKRGILYWLKVIVAILLIFILMYRCSHNYGLTAHAESPSGHPDSAFVDLTPAQTVALFGTELQGILYTAYDSSPKTITFEYAFPLNDIGYMSEGGGFMESNLRQSISSSAINSSSVYEEIIDYLSTRNGIVYIASASQWGGTNISPYYGTAYPSQLHIPFSISLSGIAGIQQAIHYSTLNEDIWMSSNSMPPNGDNKLKYLFSGDDVEVESFPGAYLSYYRTARYLLPSYPFYSGTVDESQLCTLAGCYINTEMQPDSFDCTGITLDAYCIGSSQQNSNDIWIVVQCPRLWAYTPPVVTTQTTREQPIPATFPVATMPTDITDVPSIIINDNSITQVNQLNVIIGQLNLIYAKLVANGELGFKVDLGWNPDLQDGESLPYYDTVIQSQMHDIINGHTTATVPNFDTSFVKDGYDFLTDNAWIAKMGALSLALSVAAWIIFRGRGG